MSNPAETYESSMVPPLFAPAARREMTTAIRGQMEGPLRAVTEGAHVVLPFHALLTRGHR
jgi:hypothetical protein